MSHPIRISASRLKTLKDCTMLFYLKEVVGLPESSHWKARVGTLAHLVFECLLNPRRVALFRAILDTLTIRDRPALVRFVTWQLRRNDITLSSVEEIEELLRVALLWVRPHFINAAGEFTPPKRVLREHRFKLKVGDAVVSGFIDLALIWDDRCLLGDLKSQRDKFTRAEVPNLIQAAIYQLAIYREFGLLAPVEFVLLRHPPSPRYPRMHIQRVEAPSRAHLAGLEGYIEAMYAQVNQFGLEDAMSHPHDDPRFCEKVCQFYRPFTYRAVLRGDELVKTYLLSETPVLKEGERIEERQHDGCLCRWRG